MQAKLNEVEINGKVYVEKGEVAGPVLAKNYVIVRTRSAGVFAGDMFEHDYSDIEDESAGLSAFTIKNARRLWYWSGAATLSQLAMEGVKRPNECKFPQEVPWVYLPEVIEIIPATEAAQKSIKAVPEWRF